MALRARLAAARHGDGAVPPDRPARRPGHAHDRHRAGGRLARLRRTSPQRRHAPLHGRLRSEARARHPRRRQPRDLCRDAGRPHHAERRRLHQDGPSRTGEGGEGVQGHGGPLPRLRLRSRRRPGRGGADRALFHGRRGLRPIPRPSVPGLFVAGEDASGMHGANRLGGNGVANSTVFGGIAGDVMPRWIAANPGHRDARRATCSMPKSRARCIRSAQKPGDLNALREKLLDSMWDDVGVIRDRAGHRPRHRGARPRSRRSCWRPALADADRRFNLTWHDWLNLRSLVEISRVIALAAPKAREFARRAFPVRLPGAGRSRHLAVHGGAAAGAARSRSASSRSQFTHVKPGETLLRDSARGRIEVEASMIPLSSIQRTAEDLMAKAAIEIPDDYLDGPAPLRRYRKRRSVGLRHQGDAGELRSRQGRPPRHVRRHRRCRAGTSRSATRRGSRAARSRWKRRCAAPPRAPPTTCRCGPTACIRSGAPITTTMSASARRRSNMRSIPTPTGSSSPPCTRAACSAPTTACCFPATASTASSGSISTR